MTMTGQGGRRTVLVWGSFLLLSISLPGRTYSFGVVSRHHHGAATKVMPSEPAFVAQCDLPKRTNVVPSPTAFVRSFTTATAMGMIFALTSLVAPLPAAAADSGASAAANAKLTTGGASTLQSGRTISITRGVNLDGSDFHNQNLKGVAFQQSIVRDADFRNANLVGASFFDATVDGSDFENADMTLANVEMAQFNRANLKNAVLKEVYVSGATLFTGVKSIENTDWSETYLRADQQKYLCEHPTAKGTNPTTGVDTRESLMCRVSLLYLAFFSYGDAKEMIATYDWQKVGPNDTLPAGLEIRMDLGAVGGKWARLPPKEIDGPNNPVAVVAAHHPPRCGPSCKERQRQRAEKRRTAGFLLREPRQKHRRGEEQPEEHLLSATNASTYQVAAVFLIGLGLGLSAARGVRRGKAGGLHES